MSTVSKQDPEIIPPEPNRAPPQKANLSLLIVGLIVGIVGTIVIMGRLRPASIPAQTSTAQQEASRRESSGEVQEQGHIHLSAEAKERAGIQVESARFMSLGESVTVPGTVEVSPNRSARITPPVSGKIVRLLANPGDTVRVGQPLAVLDSFDVAQARAAVRQAEANRQQARATVQTAQAETAQARAGVQQALAELEQARTKRASADTALQRQRDLAAAGAFSQAPLQTAQSELSAAQSELLQAQNALQTHTVALQRAERLFKEELVSRAELEQAQLEQQKDQTAMERAKARVDIAKQALSREQKVYSGDLLTKQAVQTAEAEVRAAQGEVQKAQQGVFRARQDVLRAETGEQAARTSLQGMEAAVSAARSNLVALTGAGQADSGGLLTLRAPFGGTVTERQASLSEAVERSTVLFVIENLNTVMVSANVPEKDVARVRIGQPVRVSVAAYPGQSFPGLVQSLAGRVDEKTRTLPVRCLVENRGGRLRPEMFASVALAVGDRSKALVVPLSALEEDGDQQFVFVEEDGYEKRKVEIGRKTEAMAEILSGVKLGEKVVVAGVFALKSEGKKAELKGDND